MKRKLRRFAHWLLRITCPHKWQRERRYSGEDWKPAAYYWYEQEVCQMCWRTRNVRITHTVEFQEERYPDGSLKRWQAIQIPVESA